MPELPDVEGFRRVLMSYAVGPPIEHVDVQDEGVLHDVTAGRLQDKLRGRLRRGSGAPTARLPLRELIPIWAKDLTIGSRLTNAQARRWRRTCHLRRHGRCRQRNHSRRVPASLPSKKRKRRAIPQHPDGTGE
jgi:hypothetical protein